jgi:hypothetical protein
LVGALTDNGVNEKDAHVYSEGVRRGGTLVTVRADDARAVEAERILNEQRPVDINARRMYYADAGWSAYDPKSPGYTKEQIARNARPTAGYVEYLQLVVTNRRPTMNWDTVKGDWKQFSGKVKEQWGKLTTMSSRRSMEIGTARG